MNDASRATRPSILVVEDHRSLRASVVSWLQCRFPGSLVQGVESGEEALAHTCAARPNVVLMDINLPGIDGLEATRRIKAQAPKTAVVMLTTHDTPRHRLAAAKAGASGYISKRDMETLLEATVECLLQSRARS
jgi:DNA-binding NarL/FixJ family response regulator